MGTASSENEDVALSEDKTNNPNIQMLDQIILYRKKDLCVRPWSI
jgi:hypothetical protein